MRRRSRRLWSRLLRGSEWLSLCVCTSWLPTALGCGVQCLGLPVGCRTEPVVYTTSGGGTDEWTFGSNEQAEWFLDVHDMMLTDHLEDPRAHNGTCPMEYETEGVVCACAFTRAELEAHDEKMGGGQDLLVQLEAAAGFNFGAGGGLCFTTDRASAAGGWIDDVDCPSGGIGYAKTCPQGELQRKGGCGMGAGMLTLFIVVVGVLLLVFGRVLCRTRPAGPTLVSDQAAPRHTRPATMAAVP